MTFSKIRDYPFNPCHPCSNRVGRCPTNTFRNLNCYKQGSAMPIISMCVPCFIPTWALPKTVVNNTVFTVTIGDRPILFVLQIYIAASSDHRCRSFLQFGDSINKWKTEWRSLFIILYLTQVVFSPSNCRFCTVWKRCSENNFV